MSFLLLVRFFRVFLLPGKPPAKAPSPKSTHVFDRQLQQYNIRACHKASPFLTNFMRRYQNFYSLRSASIGSRFAAFIEGISPKTMPISMENNTAITDAGTLIATATPDILFMM